MSVAKLKKTIIQAGTWIGVAVLAVFAIRASKAPEGFIASVGNQFKSLFNLNEMA